MAKDEKLFYLTGAMMVLYLISLMFIQLEPFQ